MFGLWKRTSELVNLLGLNGDHAAQTSQQVPMTTARTTKLCRNTLSRSIVTLFIIAKLSRVRLNQNSCVRKPQYIPTHRGMRHYTSYHNAVVEDPAAAFAHHAAVIHRNGLAKELHNRVWPKAICISPAKDLANSICKRQPSQTP